MQTLGNLSRPEELVSPAPDHVERGNFASRLLLASVALLALVTAFFRLGARGLWGDEVWELAWSHQQSLLGAIGRFTAPPDLPLSFMLTDLATTFDKSAPWVRLSSALLATATVVLLFILGRRLFGSVVGLLAAVLLAVAPYHVWYAQDARPYAGLAFYALLTLWFFFGLWLRPSLAVALGFAAATTLDLYNHLFGLFPLAAELAAAAIGTALVLLGKRSDAQADEAERLRRVWVGLIGGTALALLLSIPILPGIITYLRGGGQAHTAAPFSLTPGFVLQLFEQLGAGSGWPFWLITGFFVAGVIVAARRPLFIVLALLWLAVPLDAIAVTHPTHLMALRYFLFLQPVYVLVVGLGMWGLGTFIASALRRGVRTPRAAPAAFSLALLVPVLAAMIPATWVGYWVEKTTDWTDLCSYLHRHVQLGDAITGNLWATGIIEQWCWNSTFFHGTTIDIAQPGVWPIASLADSGRPVWYIALGQSPDLAYLRRHFVLIPHNAWARPGLSPSGSYAGRVIYPQSEVPATLYYHPMTHVPRRVVFHDDPGRVQGPGWPDYANIAPGGSLYVHLSLPPKAPRLLHLAYLGTAPLLVSAGRPIMQANVPGRVVWGAAEMPLPRSLPATLFLRIRNVSTQVGAVSEVDLRYATGQGG